MKLFILHRILEEIRYTTGTNVTLQEKLTNMQCRLSSILVFIMMAYGKKTKSIISYNIVSNIKLGIFGNAAGLVLSTTPQSRNVSAGTMVEFTCAAPASGLTSFSISTTPTVGGSVTDGSDLPNGDRLITLSFIAPSDQTSISIVCVVTTTTGFNQSLAVLMIQGNRTRSL